VYAAENAVHQEQPPGLARVALERQLAAIRDVHEWSTGDMDDEGVIRKVSAAE